MDLESLKLLSPSSGLSPKVRQIVCKLDKQELRVADTSCLTLSGLINWEKIEEILPPPKEETEEYFLQTTKQLLPVSRRLKMELQNASAEKQHFFSTNLQWTSAPQMLKRCLRLLKEDNEAGLVLSLLLSTAILERSLGDVFLLRGFPCPSMLKDLLATRELQEIFGTTVMQLLQLVIGRPTSLNLRNITWHGFVGPGEIPAHYAWLLLGVAASLGALLEAQGICLKKIPHRAPITFPQADLLKNVFPDISVDDLPCLRSLCGKSMFIPVTMQPFWSLVFDTFMENRYGECIVLLLPLLEHGMRRLYCVANNCQDRLLTAESTVLFTTFDEILSPTKADGEEENRLRRHVGDEHITLLLDLLTYPEGPRLRDTVSHGEVDLDSCPPVLAKHLLGVCLSFCLLALPRDSTLQQEAVLQQIDEVASTYQSIFHPISVLKKQITAIARSLSEWNTLPRPLEDEVETKVMWDTPSVGVTVGEAVQRLLEMVPFNSENFTSLVQPFEDMRPEIERILTIPICTLYRGWHKQMNIESVSSIAKTSACCRWQSREDEVLKLLRRITTECCSISDQVQLVLRTRHTQWQNKELRSRQRKTYLRMIDSIPLISSGLRLVTLLTVIQLYTLDELSVSHVDQQAKCVKMLKNVLQKCENVRSSTAANKSRWDEGCSLINELVHNVHGYLYDG